MKQFLESLIKSIVENPDDVVVTESQDEGDRQLLTIKVNSEDMGRVIGKSGKVINSIRTIMRVVAIRQGVKIRVDILDEERDGSTKPETKTSSAEATETTDEPSASTADLVSSPDTESEEPEAPKEE